MSRRPSIRVLATGPDVTGSGGAGIQRHVRTLATGFPSDSEIVVTPFAVTSTVYDEPWLLKGLRLTRRYLVFLGAARGYDVVHLNSTIDDRSIARDAGFVMLSGLLRRRVVLQFHGGGIHRLRHVCRGLLGRWVARCVRRADVVVFLSEEQGEPLREMWHLERVVYVRNYVDVKRFPEPSKCEHEGLRILYLGRLDAPKGVLETMEAFEAARETGWELRIAGAGSIAREVADRAGMSEGVSYLGFLDDQARDRELAWADVFVLPSDHDEGLPYAALEAAAAGLALVTSDKGALRTINVDGQTGIVVGSRDVESLTQALRRLSEVPGECERFGRAARALVEEHFSFAAMRERFSDIYASVLESGRVGQP